MKPIGSADSPYDLPPTGKFPAICPRCGTSLAQFIAGEPLPPSLPASTLQTLPHPPEPGDLYVPPEPRLVNPTELMRIGAVTAPPAPVAHPTASTLSVLDDPKIGGKVTICVLLFGAHHNLHRRCLNSIMTTVPPSRMDLRVATNQVAPETVTYLQTLPITKVYADTRARRKYPAMREMFWDPVLPINTQWLIWFDDDTWVRPECSRWLSLLGDAIVSDPDPLLGMLGMRRQHPLIHASPRRDPRQWFRSATWWRNRSMRDAKGNPIPNGSRIHFCPGGFFALRVDAMKACDIPDTRLCHNGGDIVIGEQLWQGGFTLRSFNEEKSVVAQNDSPRRGFRERFPFYV